MKEEAFRGWSVSRYRASRQTNMKCERNQPAKAAPATPSPARIKLVCCRYENISQKRLKRLGRFTQNRNNTRSTILTILLLLDGNDARVSQHASLRDKRHIRDLSSHDQELKMADLLGDTSLGDTLGDQPEVDPAADFLAREQDDLAELGEDFGGGQPSEDAVSLPYPW